MDSSVSPKDEIWFLRVCHHISTGLYFCISFAQTKDLGVTAPVMLELGDKCWKVVKLQAAATLTTVHIELEFSGETFPLCSVSSNI